jgi:hypothetical protein
MSHMQRIIPLPRTHGEPCPRLLARAASLKGDAAEVAYRIQCLPAWDMSRLAAHVVEHQALILRSHAATLMAHGHYTLGREYARSARRLEQ